MSFSYQSINLKVQVLIWNNYQCTLFSGYYFCWTSQKYLCLHIWPFNLTCSHIFMPWKDGVHPFNNDMFVAGIPLAYMDVGSSHPWTTRDGTLILVPSLAQLESLGWCLRGLADIMITSVCVNTQRHRVGRQIRDIPAGSCNWIHLLGPPASRSCFSVAPVGGSTSNPSLDTSTTLGVVAGGGGDWPSIERWASGAPPPPPAWMKGRILFKSQVLNGHHGLLGLNGGHSVSIPGSWSVYIRILWTMTSGLQTVVSLQNLPEF